MASQIKAINVQNVHKSYKTLFSWKKILNDISFNVPANRNLGILGRNGAGKSTLIEIICGLISPDKGKITYNNLRISWPVGRASFQGSLSGYNNLKFVCRIYNYPFEKALSFVKEFSELNEYLYMPLNTYSLGMRSRFSFAASMALECFDTYLIDEGFNAGDARFTNKVQEVFKSRLRGRNIICVSHNQVIIKRFCDYVGILNGGKIDFYEDINQAIEIYKKL